MKITNETYVECPNCGVIGRNVDEIHQLFGYYIRHDQMIPNAVCKNCRISQKIIIDIGDKRPVKLVEWGNVAYWVKNLNMRREQFLTHLEELGYIELDDFGPRGKKLYAVTEIGRKHCKMPFDSDDVLLWDYETYSKIVMMKLGCMMSEE